MLYGEVSGQALDERKFAERRDLCSLHIDIEYLGIGTASTAPSMGEEKPLSAALAGREAGN